MASGGKRSNFKFTLTGNEPDYFKDAYEDLGVQETTKSGQSNPVVERYISDTIGKRMNATTTPWCAFFVGSKLERNGFKSSKSGMARSYLKYGLAVEEDDYQVGDLVVLYRGAHDDGVLGHIGFLAGWSNTHVVLLGGNQGDQVSFQSFHKSKILAVRRPKKITQSRTVQAAGVEVVNTGVLKPAVEALPDPRVEVLEKVDEAVRQSSGLLDVLGTYKPYIKIALLAISAITVLLIIYYRTQDFNEKGRV